MGFQSNHWTDEATQAPEGGQTFGPGFTIAWQRGPLGRGEGRLEQNGAFVEDVIAAAADRIECYQASKFKSDYNADALTHLYAALQSLKARTADREKRNVEGTHEV